jgi:hypothetical protein
VPLQCKTNFEAVRRSLKNYCCILLLAFAGRLSAEAPPALQRLAPAALLLEQRAAAAAVQAHQQGTASVLAALKEDTQLFPRKQNRSDALIPRERKEWLWALWRQWLEFEFALEALEQRHDSWVMLSDSPSREASFLIRHAASLASHAAALDLIHAAELNPEVETVLNEAVPEYGLPAKTYAKIKLRHLNPLMATKFASGQVIGQTFQGENHPTLRKLITNTGKSIWKSAGSGATPVQTLVNALSIAKQKAKDVWHPAQKGISEWMGDTKVRRKNRSLITPVQITALAKLLEPGDVLLERREWYLSNVGLPGFWPHAALYIGTPAERATLSSLPEVQKWVRKQGEPTGQLEALLKRTHPEGYAAHLKKDWQNHAHRVIEAISEGVSLTTLEHSADCDSLAALRPQLKPVEKARALVKAFAYLGRPYDFEFDFSTDATLVCTELIYKAYEPAWGYTGLKLPTVKMLGRRVMPANELVKQYATQAAEGKAQFQLLTFLDGSEKSGTATIKDDAAFRGSCERSKWFVLGN